MIAKSMPPPVNASKCPVENHKPAQPQRVIPVRQLECSGLCSGPNEKRALPITRQRAKSADRANCNQTTAVSRPMGQPENGRAFDLRNLTQNRCRSDFQLHSPQQHGQDMQYTNTSGTLNGFESPWNSGYTETPQQHGCCERNNPYEVNGQPTRNYNARNAFPDNREMNLRDRNSMDNNAYQRSNNEMPTSRRGNFQVRCLGDTADEVYQEADPDMRNYRFGNVRPFNVNATKSRQMDNYPEPALPKGANRCCQNGEQSYEANFARGQPLSSTMAYPRAEAAQCDSDFDRTQQQSLASSAMTNRSRAPQMTSANVYSRAEAPQCDSDFDRTQQQPAAMANRRNRPPFAVYNEPSVDESRRARPPFGIYEDSTLDQSQQNPTFNVYCDSTMNGNQPVSNPMGRGRSQEPSSYAQQYQMSEPPMQRLQNSEPMRSTQQESPLIYNDNQQSNGPTDRNFPMQYDTQRQNGIPANYYKKPPEQNSYPPDNGQQKTYPISILKPQAPMLYADRPQVDRQQLNSNPQLNPNYAGNLPQRTYEAPFVPEEFMIPQQQQYPNNTPQGTHISRRDQPQRKHQTPIRPEALSKKVQPIQYQTPEIPENKLEFDDNNQQPRNFQMPPHSGNGVMYQETPQSPHMRPRNSYNRDNQQPNGSYGRPIHMEQNQPHKQPTSAAAYPASERSKDNARYRNNQPGVNNQINQKPECKVLPMKFNPYGYPTYISPVKKPCEREQEKSHVSCSCEENVAYGPKSQQYEQPTYARNEERPSLNNNYIQSREPQIIYSGENPQAQRYITNNRTQDIPNSYQAPTQQWRPLTSTQIEGNNAPYGNDMQSAGMPNSMRSGINSNAPNNTQSYGYSPYVPQELNTPYAEKPPHYPQQMPNREEESTQYHELPNYPTNFKAEQNGPNGSIPNNRYYAETNNNQTPNRSTQSRPYNADANSEPNTPQYQQISTPIRRSQSLGPLNRVAQESCISCLCAQNPSNFALPFPQIGSERSNWPTNNQTPMSYNDALNFGVTPNGTNNQHRYPESYQNNFENTQPNWEYSRPNAQPFQAAEWAANWGASQPNANSTIIESTGISSEPYNSSWELPQPRGPPTPVNFLKSPDENFNGNWNNAQRNSIDSLASNQHYPTRAIDRAAPPIRADACPLKCSSKMCTQKSKCSEVQNMSCWQTTYNNDYKTPCPNSTHTRTAYNAATCGDPLCVCRLQEF